MKHKHEVIHKAHAIPQSSRMRWGGVALSLSVALQLPHFDEDDDDAAGKFKRRMILRILVQLALPFPEIEDEVEVEVEVKVKVEVACPSFPLCFNLSCTHAPAIFASTRKPLDILRATSFLIRMYCRCP